MSNITLYDYWRSSASYRVRIALHIAGLDFKSISVDLSQGHHKSEEHVRRNPQAFVPVIDIDGQMLSQSLTIIEYLDDTRNLNLFPKNAMDRAKVNALAHTIALDIHPICNLSVSSEAEKISGETNFKKKWIHKFMKPGLEAFEIQLEKLPKSTYCFNENPTIADICLLPQIYNAIRWEIDISKFDRINLVIEACEKNPAFIKAHPDMLKPNQT